MILLILNNIAIFETFMNTTDDIKTTPLYDLHQQLGGKMVPFAGYQMPVQYPLGIIKEHLHTRSQAGLFDVSHMGQVIVSGAGTTAALEKLVPVDLAALPHFKQSYALFTNAQGGVEDDLMITRWGDEEYLLVVNAACKDQDIAYLKAQMPNSRIEPLADRGLIALQGPAAKDVMATLAPEANQLIFMTGCWVNIAGADCHITRSGYTGEDGFEISIANDQLEEVTRLLLANDSVEAIGLGARDALRLEAGLCLYGHDINQQTTPVEASLNWSISPSRRLGGAKQGGFPGADIILPQFEQKPSKKRVGLLVDGRSPIREGVELISDQGDLIGAVTSGGFGASAAVPVAMGYVNSEYSQVGTHIQALLRGKPVKVTISKLPFVVQSYYRG